MRFTVQKYEPVATSDETPAPTSSSVQSAVSYSDRTRDPECPEAKRDEDAIRDVPSNIRPPPSQRICLLDAANFQPPSSPPPRPLISDLLRTPGNVRFVDYDDAVSIAPSELLNGGDGHVELVDSTATVRRPANRRASVVVDHLAQQGRLFSQRYQRRLVFKDGSTNISSKNVPKRKRRYLVDIFTTFVDMRWRYHFALFAVAFFGSWFAFAAVWWAEALVHGDHRALNDTDWPTCVAGVYDFQTALLYSIETQQTIGYGTRAIDTNCPFAILLLMLQSCYGVFVQSLMTGLIFAKLSRPKHRALTMMFSKHAVICRRDHEFCLKFRVGDMRRSHIIGTSIRAMIVRNRLTTEGERIPLCQSSLDVETETNFGDSFVFLAWPVTVVHRIVAGSPLWDVSMDELLTERFEIIVIMEGVVENTGHTTQFRTSYLPAEIKWGHRLKPLLTFCKGNGQYDIDFGEFHNTLVVESMPVCSARSYAEHRAASPGADSKEDGGAFSGNFTSSAELSRPTHRHIAGASLRKFVWRRNKKPKKSRSLELVSVDSQDLVNAKILPDTVAIPIIRVSDSSDVVTVDDNENLSTGVPKLANGNNSLTGDVLCMPANRNTLAVPLVNLS